MALSQQPPVPFAQVYIVFGNTSEGKVLHCADSNLEIVLDPDIDSGIQPAYNPTHLIVDFEAAAIKAFLEMYPALSFQVLLLFHP